MIAEMVMVYSNPATVCRNFALSKGLCQVLSLSSRPFTVRRSPSLSRARLSSGGVGRRPVDTDQSFCFRSSEVR